MDVFFSDFDSYSDTSILEDQEDDEVNYDGQARCIFSNLEDTIGKIDNFLSSEQVYVHGDIVCSIADPSGQIGKVINIQKVVDLENAYGNKINGINSKNLQRIRSISIGDYVVSGQWVGKVNEIVDHVTILFDDSTKCVFTNMDNTKLISISSPSFDDPQFHYFLGQRVKLERARWSCGTHNDEHNEGTICGVDAGFVYVNWLGYACSMSEPTMAPLPWQNARDLTPLSCFPHSNWQLGDWCVPRTSEYTNLMKNFHPHFQEIFVIINTKTKVDVLWQDGSESQGLDSLSISPVSVTDTHDFWPHQYVLEKETSNEEKNMKWGIVKIVDAKEKTVKVKWESLCEKDGIEETLSAYELTEHPEFSYCLGDVVFRLKKEKNVECTEQSYSIGIVIGFANGIVEVKWAASSTTKVAPYDIFRMEKCEAVSATTSLHHHNNEPNRVSFEHEDHVLNRKAKDLMDILNGNEKGFLKGLYHSNTFNIPRATIGFLSKITAFIFGSPPYTLSPTFDSFSKEQRSCFQMMEERVVSVETTKEAKIKENVDKPKDISFSSSSKNLEVGKFEMVNDYSAHHFTHRAKGMPSYQVKRSWIKTIQQEWNILMKDLPETIYVRVIEERIDLLHAAIVGAPGTPYHDGLFFFDIFFPPDYPQEPPMVHYISGGLRLNPNLYESGRVCLSLLNTWTGTGTETWNPKGSTILQVLLSLQALVLNKNPYFNEAGFDQQVGSVEGEKNSRSYNENAFLMSCKSMIYTLRKPPKHFEVLIEEHFNRRCTNILMACKAYMQGVPVGEHFQGESCTESIGQNESSTGFKIALSNLFPKLMKAFSEKGFICGDQEDM